MGIKEIVINREEEALMQITKWKNSSFILRNANFIAGENHDEVGIIGVEESLLEKRGIDANNEIEK